uniref:Uncharacterized protein n=1 Tax=Setaria viridis TaxID=4556 RepID=A0A4U6TEZ0_SETVI|nr:hypothetical protein SEVIR_8G135250v2 [Setaria viridis]
MIELADRFSCTRPRGCFSRKRTIFPRIPPPHRHLSSTPAPSILRPPPAPAAALHRLPAPNPALHRLLGQIPPAAAASSVLPPRVLPGCLASSLPS